MVSRWWLASASFPVLAGVLCAMAIMFNVCTVSQGWHEIINLDGSISIITQPAWAVVLEAVSLALAVIAYIILLLTMMSKRDPVKGFIMTILCWCASVAILSSVIGVVAGQDLTVYPPQTLQYTQNFFYGIFALGLYVLIAMLLAVYTGSLRFVHLSREDRRIVECTSIILRAFTFGVFLLGGAAVYATIEGWSFMDALYWADYTLLTIGIGNIVPKTHLGRSLLFPYATTGIMTLGLVVSSIASFSENMRELRVRFKIEKVRIGMHGCGSRDDKEKQLLHAPSISRYPNKTDILKVQRIKRDFYRKRRWLVLVLSVAAWFFFWLVSAAIFGRSERKQDWSYFASLYFTYTSLTTIGYGDLFPISNFGKAFFVFWSLLAVPVLTNLVNAMGQLGFQRLTYFLRYLWKLGASRLCPWQCLQFGMTPSSHDEEGRNRSIKNTSYPEPPSLGADSKNHARGPTKAGQLSKDLRAIEKGSSSADTKQEHSESIDHATQHNLLLSEEIGKLVSILKDESTQLDLYSQWIRIIPLLHPESDAESGLLETTPPTALHGRARIAMELMGSDRSVTDTNKEILWMLKFLTEKLCSQLREELYREAK